MANATNIAIRGLSNGSEILAWRTPASTRENYNVGKDNISQANYVSEIRFTLTEPATSISISFKCGGVDNTQQYSPDTHIRYKLSSLVSDPELINGTNAIAGDGTFRFASSDGYTIPSPLTITRPLRAGTYYLYLYGGTRSNINSQTVTVTYTIPASYTLSLSVGTNANGSVTISSSQYRGTTSLSNGSKIYQGEQIKITFSGKTTGYKATATYNGDSISSGSVKTPTANVTVVITAKAQGAAVIGGQTYLAYIYDGSNFNLYVPMIWTGSAWEIY